MSQGTECSFPKVELAVLWHRAPPLADFLSYQMKKHMNAQTAVVAAHWQVFLIFILRSCILSVEGRSYSELGLIGNQMQILKFTVHLSSRDQIGSSSSLLSV